MQDSSQAAPVPLSPALCSLKGHWGFPRVLGELGEQGVMTQSLICLSLSAGGHNTHTAKQAFKRFAAEAPAEDGRSLLEAAELSQGKLKGQCASASPNHGN